MKKAYLLSALIGLAIVLGGCANQKSSSTASDSTTRRGLYDPGSVGPVSGGPAGPLPAKTRFQP